MRRTLSIAAALAAALPAQSASANRIGPGYETSWGKAGVSLEQYWVDSATCGHQAAGVDLTGSDPAKALILASRILENQNGLEDIAQATRIAAPEIQWNRAATILRRQLEQCLTERGYIKFKMTKSQARHLRKLEVGSLERREYLYSLASDPAVLEAQALRGS
jgi:hypothetical protein